MEEDTSTVGALERRPCSPERRFPECVWSSSWGGRYAAAFVAVPRWALVLVAWASLVCPAQADVRGQFSRGPTRARGKRLERGVFAQWASAHVFRMSPLCLYPSGVFFPSFQ